MADITTLPTLPMDPTDLATTTIEPSNPTNDVSSEQDAMQETQDTATLDDAFEFEELDEELIIEDFTIDGICGVY